jgi:hypothetical protein
MAMLQAKICNHPLFKLLSNGAKIPQAFTGGILINECCPADAVNLLDLKKDGAEGLAAAIKAEEADAKARRAAARYLGTVDCHYFPEVSKALAGLLRADRNECVRWEAAMALGRGCCCNKTTIQALALTVSGSEKDGNPCEKSERVKQAAAASLHHCLACVGTVPAEEVPVDKKPIERPEVPTRPETPPPPKPGETSQRPGTLNISGIQLSAYYQKNENRSLTEICEEGRKTLAEFSHSAPAAMPARLGGRRSLVEMWQYAWHGNEQPVHATQEAAIHSDAKISDAKIDFAHATTAEPPIQPIPAAPAKVVPVAVPQVQTSPTAPAKIVAPASQTQTMPVTPAKVVIPASASVMPSMPTAPARTDLPAPTLPSLPETAKPMKVVPAPQVEAKPKPVVKEPAPMMLPPASSMPAAPSKPVAPFSAAPIQPTPATPAPSLPVLPVPTAPAKQAEPTTGPAITPTSYAPKAQTTTPVAESKVPPVVSRWESVTPAQPQTAKQVAPAPLQLPEPAVSRATNVTPPAPTQTAKVTAPAPVKMPELPASKPASMTAPAPTQTAKAVAPAPVAAPAPVVSSPTSVAQPAAPVLTPAAAKQLLQVLSDSPYPEQREWAAERLVAVAGPTQAMVVQAMVKAAREDAAPVVQVACIRSLVKLNQSGQDVTRMLTSLKSNSDPRVRYEADQALGKLSSGQSH